MSHCPVTADLNRHLAEQDRNESLADLIDNKLAEMMQDQSLLAACIDDVMGECDVSENGSTTIANDLAEIMIENYTATCASMATRFICKLGKMAEARMRLDAETEVNDKIARQNTRG